MRAVRAGPGFARFRSVNYEFVTGIEVQRSGLGPGSVVMEETRNRHAVHGGRLAVLNRTNGQLYLQILALFYVYHPL